MEPVTHVLTGACLARAGFNRQAAYATVTMAVAAEFPDIDTLWSLRGPVEGFAHHRGITHTLVGLPFEAALLIGVVYSVHRFRLARSETAHAKAFAKPLTTAPVRWVRLYGCALLALLTHLLLDYTNNYGIRPFSPFNPRWYAASITFIFDPLMFVMLAFALIFPGLFRLVSREVGARREPFAPRGWAIAALACVTALWSVRAVAHAQAVALAAQQTLTLHPEAAGFEENAGSSDGGESSAAAGGSMPDSPAVLLRPGLTLVSPDPLNPRRWYAASDFGPAVQFSTVDLSTETVSPEEVLFKAAPSPTLQAAQASSLGKAYLDWSPMPVLTVDTGDQTPPPAGPRAAVWLRDPRFMGSSRWLQRGSQPPLTGMVELDAMHHVTTQILDGREER